MEAYTSFAKVYDLFMDNVPYEQWSTYIVSILQEYGIEDGILLDLGCGTGKMTRIMQRYGYDMIGIDNSYEMLDIARESSNEDILYLLQDMREFELYRTVRAVYSACDSLNYILEEQELEQVFSLVNNYLDPKGLFIFDMNTTFKYEELLAEYTFAENRDSGSFIWENYYDIEEQINEYDLTLYIEEEKDKFLRFQEVHYQKCYTLEKIRILLENAGMEFLAVYDGYTKNSLHEESERFLVIAREKGKSKVIV
ncbi:MAG: methyltransferase domain-containing protein [Lachnospiraceae bacterium]|nr:methyltransferase domain-containing protein [Lachnospiraceae bacterium]